MNKAFLFDMDGVLINSENSWHVDGKDFLIDLFGEKILKQMTIGMTVDSEYELAQKHGFSMTKEEYYQRYDQQAKQIYQKSEVTQGINKLFSHLEKRGYVFGIVTASRKNWVDMVIPRIPSNDRFSLILSLTERKDLRPKPHPDGYVEAMRLLDAHPKTTIILEDSNLGIAAAKASRATTIGFRQHLLPGYKQTGADYYAETMNEVITLVNNATDSHST